MPETKVPNKVLHGHSATRIMFTLISLSAVQNMVDFIYFNTCHFHYDQVYYELSG